MDTLPISKPNRFQKLRCYGNIAWRLKFRTISNERGNVRFLVKNANTVVNGFTKLELAVENGDVVEITGSGDRQNRLPNYVFT